MAAPKGNSYGKFALNSGRPTIFKTPAELEAKAQEYFDWCDENPEYKIEMLKKPSLEEDLITGEYKWVHYISVPIKNAYQIKGLCLYLGVNVNYFSDADDLFESKVEQGKETEKDKEFSRVRRAIMYKIAAQQIQGGLNGTLDARLVARLQGIAEKKEVESKNMNTNRSDDIDYDQLDDETLEKIAKAKIKKT